MGYYNFMLLDAGDLNLETGMRCCGDCELHDDSSGVLLSLGDGYIFVVQFGHKDNFDNKIPVGESMIVYKNIDVVKDEYVMGKRMGYGTIIGYYDLTLEGFKAIVKITGCSRVRMYFFK